MLQEKKFYWLQHLRCSEMSNEEIEQLKFKHYGRISTNYRNYICLWIRDTFYINIDQLLIEKKIN